MDPYIEYSNKWRSFHASYIIQLQRDLSAVLPEGFAAEAEERIYVDTSGLPAVRTRQIAPDVSVFATASARPQSGGIALRERTTIPEIVTVTNHREQYINVVDLRSEQGSVVATVELLSPANKSASGYGINEYKTKQNQVVAAGIHLLEIDLLRAGEYVLLPPQSEVRAKGTWDYLVALFDAMQPDLRAFWRVNLRDSLPEVYLPLTPDIPSVYVDLQTAFTRCYDESRLDKGLRYADPLEPSLSPEDEAWVDALLRETGLR